MILGEMKKLFSTILLSALALAACAQSPAGTAAHGARVLTIDAEAQKKGLSDTLRFGRMNSGEVVVKHLALKNETDEPMVVIRHETSCHCTTFKYDRRPVMPGGTADIECRFDSSGNRGWQMKLVNLYVSGVDVPLKIFVEADIR